MSETKKRTFAADTRMQTGMRLTSVPEKPARGAGVRSKSPNMTVEQRQELIFRLIDFLKGL